MPGIQDLLKNENAVKLIRSAVQICGNFVMQQLEGEPDIDKEQKILDDYYEKAKLIADKQKKSVVKVHKETVDIEETEEENIPVIEESKDEKGSIRETKTTACVSCSRNHIAAAAGLLAEGKRFLKDGLTSNEVLHRIDLATQEIATMERGDLHPNKINKLPPDEKKVAEWIASKTREIRHTLDHISTEKDYVNAIDELTEFSEEITKKYYTMMEDMTPEFTEKSINNICNGLPEEKRLKCIQTMNSVMNN